MDNERIFRSLENPRVLDMPIFPEAVQHSDSCPHAHMQEQVFQQRTDIELEAPVITVEITPTGEVVGKGNKQLEKEKEPLRVRVNKFGDIERAD